MKFTPTHIRNGLGLFALVTGLLTAFGVASAAPSLVIPNQSFDFGYAPQQSELSYSYWLHSTGSDTLKILQVIPGCGCTKAPLEKETLAPGDSTRLEVTFSSKRYQGQITKQPRIQTNVGPPDMTVKFTTNIVRRPDSTFPVLIKPYKLDLTQQGDKVRDEIRFTIQNISDQALSPSMVTSRPDLWTLELPTRISAGQTAEAVLKLTLEGIGQEFEKSFTFELSDESHSRFTVPVKRVMRTISGISGTSQASDGK
jgi:hypothetical protein